MSIQQDKYKALRSNSKTTLINLAKKYNFPVPKNIKSLSAFAKRLSNHIENIQYKDYQSGIPVNDSKKPTGLYKEYLKKSKLHDTTQAKQNFKDIKEFTKIARQINKQLDKFSLTPYIDPSTRDELKNIVGNKTTVKDYIKKMPETMLKYSPVENTLDLISKTDSSYLEEIIKRNTINIKKEEVEKLLNNFNKKNYGQRFAINVKLFRDFYEEYERKRGANFKAVDTLKKIIEEV